MAFDYTLEVRQWYQELSKISTKQWSSTHALQMTLIIIATRLFEHLLYTCQGLLNVESFNSFNPHNSMNVLLLCAIYTWGHKYRVTHPESQWQKNNR